MNIFTGKNIIIANHFQAQWLNANICWLLQVHALFIQNHIGVLKRIVRLISGLGIIFGDRMVCTVFFSQLWCSQDLGLTANL